MALAEVELVPFSYVVDDASLTVTCWPAAVVIVKLGADTLLTLPTVPPAAGPDRALDAPPELRPLAEPLAGPAVPDVAEGDVVRPTESPITAHTSAATAPNTIHRLLLFESHRRTGRPGRGSWALVGS
jgi:hypothetical protein